LTSFSLLSFQPLHVSIRPFAASAAAATTSSLRAVAVYSTAAMRANDSTDLCGLQALARIARGLVKQ